jgi:hypothetical protein
MSKSLLEELDRSVPYSTQLFTLNVAKKFFVSEASDLDFCTSLFYDNNEICRGIKLYSEKTKNITQWKLTKTEQDNEGDILFWEFTPTEETVKQFCKLKGFKTTIFND